MVVSKAESRIALFDFVWTLVRTDFKVRYHGAVGGFVWALMRPIAMFVVLYRVFHFLFPETTYMLNLLIGLFLWQFFAEGTVVGLSSIVGKRHLITKVRFPRWIVVVASLSNAFIILAVFAVGLLIITAAAGKHPGIIGIAAFGFYLLLYVMMVIGFALGASVLYLQYRDLDQVWDVILQAGFFLAPIVYPIDKVPERYHFWLYLWPVTPIIQFSRSVLVDGHLPTLRAHLMLLGEAMAVLAIGATLFATRWSRAMEKL